MSWRSQSRGSNEWSRRGGASENGHAAVDGVELNFVCSGIPVLTLEKASVFHENVSWMLQSALSSSGKADSLYEYCDDDNIIAECRRLGLREEDLSLVRLKQPNLKHVKAVGTTGKRSVMLAVVVALALEDGDALGELWKELRDYKLDGPFVDLLHSGRETLSNPAGDDEGLSGSLASDGVELSVICQQVPVLGLAKDSVFQENASWLLQTALSSSGRADSLYEYCCDRDVLSQCRRLGLSDQDVGIVRLKREDLKGVKAVGTCGKRSIMLSLVVAIVLHDKVQLSVLTKEVSEYDSHLEGPFRTLVCSAMRFAGRPVQEEKEEVVSWGSWDHHGRWSGTWSGKRKWARDDDGWSQSGYKWSQPSNSSSKKRGGSKHHHMVEANEQSLDKQLEEYWGEDR